MTPFGLKIVRRFFKYGPTVSKHYVLASLKHNPQSLGALHFYRLYSNEEAPKKDDDLPENEKRLTTVITELKKDIQTMEEKAKELDDKYKRALADGENLRRRFTKQIEDAKIFGIQNFCKDLLEVADILGHATEAVPREEISDKNPHLKNLYEGLTMTKAQLNQVFKRHGLEQVNPLNEKFNPNLHEALFQQQVQNAEPNTVVVVSKIGYKLHDRCIRPALVGVSTG